MKKAQKIAQNRTQINEYDWASELGKLAYNMGFGEREVTKKQRKFYQEFVAGWKRWWAPRAKLSYQAPQPKPTAPAAQPQQSVQQVQPAAQSNQSVPTNLIAVESKRFLNTNILSEKEYAKLDLVFENIIHLDEGLTQDEANYKMAEMDAYIQSEYPKIWALIDPQKQSRQAQQYDQLKKQWITSGIFSNGGNLSNLGNFIATLEAASSPPDDQGGGSGGKGGSQKPIVSQFTKRDISDEIDSLDQQVSNMNNNDPDKARFELYLEALKHYLSVAKTR